MTCTLFCMRYTLNLILSSLINVSTHSESSKHYMQLRLHVILLMHPQFIISIKSELYNNVMTKTKHLCILTVVVDPLLGKKLRPHQREVGTHINIIYKLYINAEYTFIVQTQFCHVYTVETCMKPNSHKWQTVNSPSIRPRLIIPDVQRFGESRGP